MTQHFLPSSTPRSRIEPDESLPTKPSGITGEKLMDRMLVALGRRDYRGEVRALTQLLPNASDEQAGKIVDGLIELAASNAGEQALAAATRVYGRLSEAKGKRLIATGMGQWGGACRLAMQGAAPGERASIAALVGDAVDADATGILTTLIADEDPLVREAAGRSLIGLAARVNRPPTVDGLTRQSVEAAVVKAASEFDAHRQKAALKALLILLDSPAAMAAAGPEVRALLADDAHPMHMALRGVIKNDLDERLQHAAWVWLGLKRAAPACLDRLARKGDAASRSRVFNSGHLLGSPQRRAAVTRAASVDRGAGIAGIGIDERALMEAGGPEAAAALRIAAAGSPEAANRAVEAALAHPEPVVRHQAMRLLADGEIRAGNIEGPTDVLLDLCFDEHAGVARGAMLRAWSAARTGRLNAEESTAVFERLRRSEHETVRAMADFSGAPPIGASDGPVQRVVVRRWLGQDPAGVIEAIRERLHAGPLSERIGAIQLARRLLIVGPLELDLLAIIDRSQALSRRTPDAISRHEMRVAASAVSALGEVATSSAEQALLSVLGHADDRVRANAIDTLTRRSRRAGRLGRADDGLTHRLAELKDDAHHRVRAGALRAELLGAVRGSGNAAGAEAGEVSRRLLSRTAVMLSDSRAMHRVSGLWLAERMSAELGSTWRDFGAGRALVQAVDEMATGDGDGAVRLRASTAAARLRAVVRLGWGNRAASVPGG